MASSTYNFPNILRGDTFSAVQFTVNVNGSPKDLTSTGIKCEFRKSSKQGPSFKILTETGGITIVVAVNGIFRIDEFNPVAIEVGEYYYDIQFTDGTVIKTYIEGTLTVLQDVTA